MRVVRLRPDRIRCLSYSPWKLTVDSLGICTVLSLDLVRVGCDVLEYVYGIAAGAI